MVYHCQYTHIYRCPFQQYLKVELDRRLQIVDSYRASVKVLEKARDPNDGNQRIVLKTVWENIIPENLLLTAEINITEIEFEDEFWVDEVQQGYWRRSRNVTQDNLLQIWQASTSSKDQNNNNWTYNEEEVGVEAVSKDEEGVILESVVGKFFDNCIKANIDSTEMSLVQFYDR